jgi:hypothetical protein
MMGFLGFKQEASLFYPVNLYDFELVLASLRLCNPVHAIFCLISAAHGKI